MKLIAGFEGFCKCAGAPPRPLLPDGERGEWGDVVAVESVNLGASDVAARPWPGHVAVDAGLVKGPCYDLRRDDRGLVLVLVPTGETTLAAFALCVPSELLAPPVLDAAARERTAQAIADALFAEVSK